MIISFESEEIRRLCEDESYAYGILSSEVGEKLQNRLADMESIAFLSELNIGNLRASSKGDNFYMIDLIRDEVVLLFTVITSKNLKVRGLDKVNRIKIIDILNIQDEF